MRSRRLCAIGAARCSVVARHILLDLAAVTDLDAAGIGELVQVSSLTTAAGGTLQIARASVRRLLDRVGLLRVLEDTSTPSVNDRCGGRGFE